MQTSRLMKSPSYVMRLVRYSDTIWF